MRNERHAELNTGTEEAWRWPGCRGGSQPAAVEGRASQTLLACDVAVVGARRHTGLDNWGSQLSIGARGGNHNLCLGSHLVQARLIPNLTLQQPGADWQLHSRRVTVNGNQPLPFLIQAHGCLPVSRQGALCWSLVILHAGVLICYSFPI